MKFSLKASSQEEAFFKAVCQRKEKENKQKRSVGLITQVVTDPATRYFRFHVITAIPLTQQE